MLTPIAERTVTRNALAPRVPDLAGLRIGLLDNGKPNVDLLLDHIRMRLSERFGITKIVRRRKNRVGLVAEYLDELVAQCDVVINGVAD
ncbi:hypothetical protein ANRL1_00316 [Anaerolineae bacterium]|nr:hypothetical protein ANRL1_00316 [Anaerolineae bacterium]